jgi:hypothetical protein
LTTIVKIIKLITINILVFVMILYLGLILFTQWGQSSVQQDSAEPDLIVEYKIKPVPPELFKKIDPRLLKYNSSDQNDDDAFPYDNWQYGKSEGEKFNITVKIKNTDLIVYDVIYSFDKRYIRHVENQDHKKSTDHFILTAGCSYTFGKGLTQGEDYPSQLAKKLGPRWKIYNYGWHGSGPNRFIDRIQKNELSFNQISEKNGVYIWLYIPDHLSRYFCSLNCYNVDRSWSLNLPEITYENSTFQTKGPFRTSQNPMRKLLYFFKTMHFFDFINLPELKYSDSQYAEFVQAVDYIPKVVGSQINWKFVINLNDFSGTKIEPQLVNQFKKAGYQIINIGPYFKNTPIEYLAIPGDGHPTAAMNWVISEVIAAEMKKNINPK